jgi:hypothetical protein
MKKFRRAIGDVGIKGDGTGGVFAFWAPKWRYSRINASATSGDECNTLLDHARYFSAGKDGKLALNEGNP